MSPVICHIQYGDPTQYHPGMPPDGMSAWVSWDSGHYGAQVLGIYLNNAGYPGILGNFLYNVGQHVAVLD